MNDPFYPKIKDVLNDYYNIRRQLDNRTIIMSNYPKVIVMTIGSEFENTISGCVDNFLNHPKPTHSISVPSITASEYLTAGGEAYKKYNSKPDSTGKYEAVRFYNYFGNRIFKNLVIQEFNHLLTDYKHNVEIQSPIIESAYNNEPRNTNKEDEFEDIMAIEEIINVLTFDDAEQHLMKIKNLRNSVAHNFVADFDSSVEDLRSDYYKARIYVKAVENVFKSQTL